MSLSKEISLRSLTDISCWLGKVCPTSVFQIILVSEAKTLPNYFHVIFEAVGTIQHFTKTLETL